MSRDIAELGLIKVPGRPATSTSSPSGSPASTTRRRASDERLGGSSPTSPSRSAAAGSSSSSIGTPGTASVIAQAIDESTLHEQEGTLAGDNTLLVLFADEPRLERWRTRFQAIAGSLRRSRSSREQSRSRLFGRSRHVGRRRLAARAVRRRGHHPDRRPRRRIAPRRASRAGRCRPAPSRAYVVDARERFVTDYVWPHLQANALYQGAYPLATALARPLIAQLLVEVAKREGADAVAHGCTGKGNDQVRFDVATHALDPGLEVIAPMRVGMGLTRDQEIDYAAERGIEIPITKASPYSIDVNLWGRSCETGVLEDPWVTPPPDAYEWTVAASRRTGPGRARDRVRGRHPGRPRRRAARRGRAGRPGPRRWPAPTASGGSTTSRTAWSGSRAARSTRRRRRPSCTRRTGRSRA